MIKFKLLTLLFKLQVMKPFYYGPADPCRTPSQLFEDIILYGDE